MITALLACATFIVLVSIILILIAAAVDEKVVASVGIILGLIGILGFMIITTIGFALL